MSALRQGLLLALVSFALVGANDASLSARLFEMAAAKESRASSQMRSALGLPPALGASCVREPPDGSSGRVGPLLLPEPAMAVVLAELQTIMLALNGSLEARGTLQRERARVYKDKHAYTVCRGSFVCVCV